MRWAGADAPSRRIAAFGPNQNPWRNQHGQRGKAGRIHRRLAVQAARSAAADQDLRRRVTNRRAAPRLRNDASI